MYADHLLDVDLPSPFLPTGVQGRAFTAKTALASDGPHERASHLAQAKCVTAGTISQTRIVSNVQAGWRLFSLAISDRTHGETAPQRLPLGQVLQAVQTTGSISTTVRDRTIDRFCTMLDAFSRYLDNRYYLALQRQLTALLNDEEELSDAGVRPSMASFAGLLQFLQRNEGLKHPGLSLDSQGYFVASWQPRGRAKLSITFTGLTNAKWIASDRSGPEPKRGSGLMAGMAAGCIDERFCGWLFP